MAKYRPTHWDLSSSMAMALTRPLSPFSYCQLPLFREGSSRLGASGLHSRDMTSVPWRTSEGTFCNSNLWLNITEVRRSHVKGKEKSRHSTLVSNTPPTLLEGLNSVTTFYTRNLGTVLGTAASEWLWGASCMKNSLVHADGNEAGHRGWNFRVRMYLSFSPTTALEE